MVGKGGTYPKKPDEGVVRGVNAIKEALRRIRNEGKSLHLILALSNQ